MPLAGSLAACGGDSGGQLCWHSAPARFREDGAHWGHLQVLGIEAEFGGTIIFARSFRGVTQTIPLAIYSTLESDFDAPVALAVLVLGFSFVVILTARSFTRKAEERAYQ